MSARPAFDLIFRNAVMRSSAVTVDIGDDGVVKLKGTVSSAEKKAKAEEITRKVSGVKSVVNNLEVKP